MYLKSNVFGVIVSVSVMYKTRLNQNNRAFVVTSTQNHWIIHLFNIIKILNKFKIFQDYRIRKFSNNIDLRKVDFVTVTHSVCLSIVGLSLQGPPIVTHPPCKISEIHFMGQPPINDITGSGIQNTKSISCSSPPIMTSQTKVNRPCPLPHSQHRAPMSCTETMHGAASPSTKCMGSSSQTCRTQNYMILLLYYQMCLILQLMIIIQSSKLDLCHTILRLIIVSWTWSLKSKVIIVIHCWINMLCSN